MEKLNKNDKYVSMAEAVCKFHRGTPLRFRSKPQNDMPVLPKMCHFSTTIPQSPKFATKDRKRTVQVLSAKELEDKEVQEIKK